MDKVVLIDKPADWTSFDVVAKIRAAIRVAYVAKGNKPTRRQLKVGHAGTLDPFATGLLIILIGNACARSNEFLKLDKVYEASVTLGKTSTTGDPEGELTTISTICPTRQSVVAALQQLQGNIEQVPPIYSAIKIGGERAYRLARKGKMVDMPKRMITIYSLELLEYAYPLLRLRAHVSSGTYIRTLAEDIGKVLHVGAYCQALRRIQIGDMKLSGALTLDGFLARGQFDE